LPNPETLIPQAIYFRYLVSELDIGEYLPLIDETLGAYHGVYVGARCSEPVHETAVTVQFGRMSQAED